MCESSSVDAGSLKTVVRDARFQHLTNQAAPHSIISWVVRQTKVILGPFGGFVPLEIMTMELIAPGLAVRKKHLAGI
jgi:hypothetical protein